MTSFGASDQDQARDADGKYAAMSTTGTDTSVLDGDSDPANDSAQIEAYVADVIARDGAGMEDFARRDMEICSTPAARQLLVSAKEGNFNVTAQDVEKLSHQGYTADDLQMAKDHLVINKGFNGRGVMRYPPTAERLREIHANHPTIAIPQTNAWVAEAVMEGDASKFGGATTGVDIIETHSPERAETMRAGLAAGLKASSVTYAKDRAEVDRMIALKGTYPKTEDHLIRSMDERGHDPASAKKYGTKLSAQFSREDLDESPTPAKTLRALHTGLGSGPISMYDRYASAGLTSGKQVHALSEAMRDPSVGSVCAAARIVKPETLVAFSKSMGGSRLSDSDVANTRRLVDAGYDSPESAKVLTSSGYTPEMTRHDRGNRDTMGTFANLAESGLSPQKIGQMSRAGIPAPKMVQHKDDADMWKSGAGYREQYNRDQESDAERGWNPNAKPWPFTEDSYQEHQG